MNYKNKNWLAKKLYKQHTQKQIASYCNVHIGTIEKYVKKFNFKGLKEKGKSFKEFKISDPYFAYLVGLFVTDGYLNPQTITLEITLKNQDRKLLQIFSDYYGFNIKSYNSNYVRIYANQKQTKHFCEITGFKLGKKTFDSYVPNIFPNILKKYVVRGMIDGDGTLRKNGSIRFYSESPALLDYVEKYFIINSFVVTKQENSKVLYISENFKAGLLLYKGLPELALQRKRNVIVKIVDDIVRTYQMINDMKWCN